MRVGLARQHELMGQACLLQKSKSLNELRQSFMWTPLVNKQNVRLGTTHTLAERIQLFARSWHKPLICTLIDYPHFGWVGLKLPYHVNFSSP